MKFENKGEHDKWISMMQTLEYFNQFTDNELEEILKIASPKKYQVGEYILAEGKASTSLFILIKGKALILQKNIDEEEQEIREIFPGECIGEVALLLNASRSASVKAISESYVFVIDEQQLDSFEPGMKAKMFRQIATVLARRLLSYDINQWRELAEDIKFPCGCRTTIEVGDIEFSYCDQHSLEKKQADAAKLERTGRSLTEKIEEAQKETRRVKSEADSEYFSLLEKYKLMERKLKSMTEIEAERDKLTKENERSMEKLRQVTIEFINYQKLHPLQKKVEQ